MPGRYAFPRSARLAHDREYQRVARAGIRRARGVFVVQTIPNDLDHHRLGLSIGRRAGSAVERHRIKRLVREGFRLTRAAFPKPHAGCFDVVVALRGPLPGDVGLKWMLETIPRLVGECHEAWARRAKDGDKA